MSFINFVPVFIAMQTSQNLLRQRNMANNAKRNLSQKKSENKNNKKARG